MTGSVLLAACCLALPTPEAPAPRVLIVTGVDHPAHNWKLTAPVLKGILEREGCQVDVTEDPDTLATDRIFAYDALVLHFRNETPLPHDAQAQANLARFVQQEGRGLVVVHFACGAFPYWSGFGDLAGMVWDGVNTHDPRGPFRVRVLSTPHPITEGLSDFDADDELYTGLAQKRPVDLLAQARSKVTGKDHPMAFAFTCGKGRVFQTPLGHDVKALQMPGVTELLQRGTTWAATRPDPPSQGKPQP